MLKMHLLRLGFLLICVLAVATSQTTEDLEEEFHLFLVILFNSRIKCPTTDGNNPTDSSDMANRTTTPPNTSVASESTRTTGK